MCHQRFRRELGRSSPVVIGLKERRHKSPEIPHSSKGLRGTIRGGVQPNTCKGREPLPLPSKKSPPCSKNHAPHLRRTPISLLRSAQTAANALRVSRRRRSRTTLDVQEDILTYVCIYIYIYIYIYVGCQVFYSTCSQQCYRKRLRYEFNVCLHANGFPGRLYSTFQIDKGLKLTLGLEREAAETTNAQTSGGESRRCWLPEVPQRAKHFSPGRQPGTAPFFRSQRRA